MLLELMNVNKRLYKEIDGEVGLNWHPRYYVDLLLLILSDSFTQEEVDTLYDELLEDFVTMLDKTISGRGWLNE